MADLTISRLPGVWITVPDAQAMAILIEFAATRLREYGDEELGTGLQGEAGILKKLVHGARKIPKT